MPQPCLTAFLVCYHGKSNKKQIRAQVADFVYEAKLEADVRENNRAWGEGKVRHTQ